MISLDYTKIHQKRVESKIRLKKPTGKNPGLTRQNRTLEDQKGSCPVKKKGPFLTGPFQGQKGFRQVELHHPKIQLVKGSSSISERNVSIFNPSQKLESKFFKNFLMTKGHLGSQKWTKNMADSLAGIRHGMSFFDAEKTKIACSRVIHFLKTYKGQDPKENSQKPKLDILFVNTSEQYRHLVKKVARISNQRYINEKWVGGTLTNWSQISQSYSLFGRFHLLFGQFLKKRKIHLPLYEKAQRIYSGLLPEVTGDLLTLKGSVQKNSVKKGRIHGMKSFEKTSRQSRILLKNGLPDIIFLINPEENQNVLHEANLLKIPVIALADSHTKVSGIDYMIPGNIQSMEFIYWCLNLMTITLQKRNKEKQF